MWLLIFLCLFISAIANVSASSGDETSVFRKCCLKDHSLIKVTDLNLDFEDRYDCMNSVSAERTYNLSSLSTLIVGDNVAINYSIPKDCDALQAVQISETELDLAAVDDVCYDRLVSEVVISENGTLMQDIPKTVALICIRNKTENAFKSKLKINHIRKCCPDGQGFDAEYHLCRDIIEEESDEEWILRRLKVSQNHIYEIENGLDCKSEEYSVELSESTFSFSVEGSALYVRDRDGESRVPQGQWCIDREFGVRGLMARVCTKDCSAYGAYCLKKCCPVGQHFQPLRCGSLRSICVPNNDDAILFNISSYLSPLKKDYGDLVDVLGVQVGLVCTSGKFVLNQSSESDRHYLTSDGLMIASSVDPHHYCLEAFDVRECNQTSDVVVTAVACFVAALPERDFIISAVANTVSAVCLAVTLVVYCGLPELRNLHGRTVISHVSMMLLAYSCLARVQFNKVHNNNLCIMLGYGIYFGFVAAFVWLNVMCFDIWWTFGSIRTVQPLRKASAERRRFLWYSFYAWGLTLLVTFTVFLLDRYPVANFLDANMGQGICWFGSVQNSESDWPHYIFFVIPMGVLTCINLVLWGLTARHCAQVKSEVHRLQAGSVGDRAKKRFRIDRAKYLLTGKLWVVMGAGWFSELLSTLTGEPPWLWRIIDLINELQGLFILIILVFKPKVYYLIKKRLGLEKPDTQKNGTASSGRTSSTFLSRTISSDERANLRTSLPNNDIKRPNFRC